MEWWRPEIVFPVLGALGAGAAVGLEREFRGQQAGLRTHLLVCLASAFLMLMSIEQAQWARSMPSEIVRLDPQQIQDVVQAAPDEVRACLGFIANTGVRVGTALATERSWIDLRRGFVHYPATAMKGPLRAHCGAQPRRG